MPEIGGRAVAQQLQKIATRQAEVQQAAKRAAADIVAERAQAQAELQQEAAESTPEPGTKRGSGRP